MHTASCFSITPTGAAGPLHPLYLFPSLLVPGGVWTDHLSLDQWTLPRESQTLGDTGDNKRSWDPCDHHALGQEVSKLF